MNDLISRKATLDAIEKTHWFNWSGSAMGCSVMCKCLRNFEREEKKMIDLPDAPWIRFAEINGMPEVKHPCCPICGSEDSDYFYVSGNEVIGCTCCVDKIEVWDLIEQEE